MKTITITGINNRYQLKKILNPNLPPITKKKYDGIIKQYPNMVDISFQINILNNILNKYKNTTTLTTPSNTDTSTDIITETINTDTTNNIHNDDIIHILQLTHTETLIQNEIKLKIYNYKSQDVFNKFNTNEIISLIQCIELLINSNNKCYYCNEICYIFYQHIRCPNQWTLDRIDNSIGHNLNNVVIACLQCNLKRKNTNSNKFLQSKQLKLIKLND